MIGIGLGVVFAAFNGGGIPGTLTVLVDESGNALTDDDGNVFIVYLEEEAA